MSTAKTEHRDPCQPGIDDLSSVEAAFGSVERSDTHADLGGFCIASALRDLLNPTLPSDTGKPLRYETLSIWFRQKD